MRRSLCLLAITLAVPACHKEPEKPAQPERKLPPYEAPAPAFLTPNKDIPVEEMYEEIDDEDAPGAKRRKREGGEYTAAEFKEGASRWKDCGVYLDGKPIAVMTWPELPVTLQPVWVKDKVSARKRPGSDDPGWAYIEQRHYRFTDYLTALGVDVKKVKELHVYGPNPMNVIVADQKSLKEKGDGFLFRFGGEIEGKAIPVVPPEFGNGKSPDKVSAVMIYVKKKPPTLVRNKGMELDGKLIKDVPYYGEPMRGGVRVYFDDKLAAVIKRRLLEEAKVPSKIEGDRIEWSMFGFLESQGVDTKKIAEAWTIRNERRKDRLTREQLQDLSFESDTQASGQILLGKDRVPVQGLAFHSKPVTEDQLPKIRPGEEF